MPLDRKCPVVVTAASDAYALPLTVMLRSLVDSLAWSQGAIVYVLDCGISARAQKKILSSLPRLRLSVSFLSISMCELPEISADAHYTVATCSRLLMAMLLPRDITKIIYLDPDTVVLSDIGALWGVDLTGHTLAAVRSQNISQLEMAQWLYDPLAYGMSHATPYFNSGVLVVDLNRWRVSNVGDRCIEYLQNDTNLKYADQDALNIYFKGEFVRLPYEWNVWTSVTDVKLTVQSHDDVISRLNARSNPKILHFAGRRKPWADPLIYGSVEFYRFLRRTRWKNAVRAAPWAKVPSKKRIARMLRVIVIRIRALVRSVFH